MGSAAAKYISQYQPKVAIIGPDETTALQQGIVFASHYDQARIQRIIGNDPVSTLLNQQSANQYSTIEKETNVSFHSKEGCLYVNPDGTDSYLDHVASQAHIFNTRYQGFQNGRSLNSFTSDFNFPPTSKGIFEPSPSGHINPRLLITAQLILFKNNGGSIFNDTVNGVTYENRAFKITTVDGKIYHSKTVLLAPGAFINFLNLLENPLLLKLKSETTIWVKVSKEEAERLASLPSLLYQIARPEIQDIYLVRPLLYPDGKYYLKMGANFPADIYFDDLTDIGQWFKSGNSHSNLATMQQALKSLMPRLSLSECYSKRCIITYTKHGKPYIGPLNEKGLFVVTGGNGYSAMSSDALGKIAATVLLENNFPNEFSANDFQPVFA